MTPMSDYTTRTYRNTIDTGDMVSFQVAVKETDLWVCADARLVEETTGLVLDCRLQLESYMVMHPEFKSSLVPVPFDPYAPPLVKEMIRATADLNVGPMASVAGAIAQYVGRGLLPLSERVIVENGGDIFLMLNRPATVSIFAGESPLSEKLGVVIAAGQMPVGVCASSAKVGHSLSMGGADVVCVVSPSAARADGAATALGNRIGTKSDLNRLSSVLETMEALIGGVAIVEDAMATWGDVELVAL